MNRLDPFGRDVASSALEEAGEHARGQDPNAATTPGASSDQVGAAEDE
jgi:hypothetical protein